MNLHWEESTKLMATVELTISDEFYNKFLANLQPLVDQVEQAANTAQAAVDLAQALTGSTGPIYETLSQELKTQREVIEDLKKRVHDLGNAVAGKLSATQLELIVGQMIDDRLEVKRELRDVSNR